MSRHVEPMSETSPAEHRRRLDRTADLLALRGHLRSETRPPIHDGRTCSYCECGNISRTGTCADCLRREIERLEGR